MGANRITPSEIRRSCIVALDSVNLSKNRYSDVIPCICRFQIMVVLNSCKDYKPAARGYINASLITTSSSENISQFIATQGPLPQTYEDFWVMVMHYRCPVVVMLTRLVHNYRVLHCVEFKVIFVISRNFSEFKFYLQVVKCGDYFQAEDGPKEFGNMHIVTKWIKTTDASIVLRHLEVRYKEVR
ncbi:protein-tyrosine-phosphatase ptp1 [Quercus suber]|uniref:Protein-tyrosine-phosphatase ptp1 n=1 Tax=Quercus suber TaxID=58331 RepID=A0AAW0KK06_QUESU